MTPLRDSESALSGLALRLADETGCLVRIREPMADHTSFRIGGPADLFILVPGDNELERLLPALTRLGEPWAVVGNGTNLLVADEGYHGAVVHLGDGFRYLTRTARGLAAGAALPLPTLARAAVDEKLSGCEFLAGIPGTLGGAVRMNAGAWGVSLSDIVASVTTRREDGREVAYLPEDLEFGYRTSHLAHAREVVTRVEVALSPGDWTEVRNRTAELLAARRRSQPVGQPSAGSVFKNPPSAKAGQLLEAVGAKGLRRGGAEVSQVHANFIVNKGGATAADVRWLIRELQRRVEERFGVALEPEVQFLGAGQEGRDQS